MVALDSPVILGKSLKLRPYAIEDAPRFVQFFADKEVTQYLAHNDELSVEAEEDWINQRKADPNGLGWSIVHLGNLIGSVGFNLIDWDRSNATLGLLIGDKDYWGKGLGLEAANLAIAYGFRLGLHKIKAGFLQPNHASRRIQEKLGFRRVGREKEEIIRDGQRIDMILTELMRRDWLVLQNN